MKSNKSKQCINCTHSVILNAKVYCSCPNVRKNKFHNLVEEAWITRLDKCGVDAIWFKEKEPNG